MAWTLKNYNAYLKAAQSRGLSRKEAQATYRAQSAIQGRPLYGRDVERHPKYFKRATETAGREAKRQERAIRQAKKELQDTRREVRRAVKRADFSGAAGGPGGIGGELIYPEEMGDVEFYYGGEETGEEAEY